MRLLMLAAMMVVAQAGWAAPAREPNPPLKVTPEALMELGPDVQRVVVEADIGKGVENPQWMLAFTTIPVLLDKLLETKPEPPVDPKVLARAENPEPAYKGLKVRMTLVDGRDFELMRVFKGRVTVPGGALVREDVARGLEYWLFSTARVQRDVALGASLLPVLSFEQCRLLGMMVVATTPRQCVLPDDSLLVQTDTPADASTLKAKDFDSCLTHGVALIASFPRRCVAAGGRVFVEPPRVVEPPADAPMAEGAGGRFDVPVSPTMPDISVSVVSNPLLGGYAVSATVPEDTVSASTMVSVTLGGMGISPTDTSPSVVDVPDVAPAAGPELSWSERWGQKIVRWLGLED